MDRKLQHFKTFKRLSRKKSEILSYDTLVANERYIDDFFTVCHMWQAQKSDPSYWEEESIRFLKLSTKHICRHK